ncbi:alkene reductase [Kushneria phosphatilytica]|uniref:Alkene reductase n=1 Tax=Kushneria phosphatilytica TaxID=657387 RepID=A0A1S1NXE0_9GAMM|nr:alkene reductase [Kushneria phosphatilytica]OHV08948.1 alkene reductase [Kushneria phosphatilytica]QEL09711.1 alkene reductase [Kushneria phosphatilytica]
MSTLFEPYDLAGIQLDNRIIMAPMTRSRAPNDIPNEMGALYYRQRASAGLIISEGTPVSRQGTGYLYNPGIYGPDQLDGWAKATRAVHERGGVFFAQIWHVGRVSHTSVQIAGAAPVGPSEQQGGMAFGYNEQGIPDMLPASTPRRLATREVREIVRDFAQAAVNARNVGFDGVEIHGANGYLFEQFLNAVVNDRDDEYGGSRENRCRLLIEVVDEVCALIGSHRVGVRLSPHGQLFDMPEYDDNGETYLYLAREFNKRNLAYVHLHDQGGQGMPPLPRDYLKQFRDTYHGNLLFAGNLDKTEAEKLVNDGTIDLPVFGRLFTSNPDLVERMKNDWPLAEYDPNTFYGGDARGYVDFPSYAEEQERQARQRLIDEKS